MNGWKKAGVTNILNLYANFVKQRHTLVDGKKILFSSVIPKFVFQALANFARYAKIRWR